MVSGKEIFFKTRFAFNARTSDLNTKKETKTITKKEIKKKTTYK